VYSVDKKFRLVSGCFGFQFFKRIFNNSKIWSIVDVPVGAVVKIRVESLLKDAMINGGEVMSLWLVIALLTGFRALTDAW
jgi:hypothetical protein